jgi:hypothetical protein
LTIVKFREVIESLDHYGIIPVIIIDACYSGAAVSSRSTETLTTGMKKEIRTVGGKYAFLCSCNDRQTTTTTSEGGDFTLSLLRALNDGDYGKKRPYISISDIEDNIIKEVRDANLNNSPKIIIGDSLPDIPIYCNVKCETQKHKLSGALAKILLKLWDESPNSPCKNDDILTSLGRGAYGNKSKLSYSPWSLIEKVGVNKIKLTDRGRQLMSGVISVPETIEQDPFTSDYKASPMSKKVIFSNGTFTHQ